MHTMIEVLCNCRVIEWDEDRIMVILPTGEIVTADCPEALILNLAPMAIAA